MRIGCADRLGLHDALRYASFRKGVYEMTWSTTPVSAATMTVISSGARANSWSVVAFVLQDAEAADCRIDDCVEFVYSFLNRLVCGIAGCHAGPRNIDFKSVSLFVVIIVAGKRNGAAGRPVSSRASLAALVYLCDKPLKRLLVRKCSTLSLVGRGSGLKILRANT